MPPIVPASSRSSAFGADVLTLVSGTTIAQIITILSAPIVTRLYGPATFGLLALFTSIISIVGVIACMRYELAIMLTKSDEEAANVLGLCLIFVLIVSIVSAIPLILFQQSLVLFLKAPLLGPFLWLIPPTLLVSGIYLAFTYWNNRKKQFYRLSLVMVIGSFSSTAAQLVLGYLGHATGGALIGASILAQIVSILLLGIQIIRDHLSFFKQNISWSGMNHVLKRYSNFPKYDIWSALLNTLSWQIPIFLLAYFFSTTVVGYYSLGMMVIQLPMNFIGSAIAQVFYQRAVAAKQDGTISILVENVFKVLIVIGLFPILILTIIGQNIFSVIFGTVWAEAGVYTQIISVWALIWFISSPLSTIYIVFEKQEFGLKYNVVNFFTRLGSLIIGGLLGSPVIALLLFASSGIFVYGYLGFTMLEYSHVKRSHSIKIIATNVLMFLPAGIVLGIMKIAGINSLVLVITAIIFCLIYYIYIVRTDPEIKTLAMTVGPLKKIVSAIQK
jgi:O-antigen/teichoic acid export membrane protein